MSQSPSKNKVANGLVSASCAAVLAVYAAGYTRTQSAANRLAEQIAVRRAAVPESDRVTTPMVWSRPARPDHPADATNAKPRTAEPAGSSAATTVPSSTIDHRADVPAASPEIAAPIVDSSVPVAAIATEVKAPVDEPKKDPAPTVWKDGIYKGWGYSRHGNIEAAVTIEKGRIVSAGISQCLTRYSCSIIEHLPPQVAKRQSPEVDYVSGATQSADAFYGAVVEALNKAK